jgi:flavin reductase (DIM6/NTAB) family NADH-FMN oxidoreductase RutF
MDETPAPDVDATTFRRVMGRFPTGVAVITADDRGAPRGMTANAFMSASLHPPMCVISVAKLARMHAVIARTAHFGVNMLAEDQEDVSVHFAGGAELARTVAFDLRGPAPLIADAHARIAAGIVARHDCGDHTLVVGHILAMEADDRLPLVYHASRYARLAPHISHAPGAIPELW